jgi:hypothetical protein
MCHDAGGFTVSQQGAKCVPSRRVLRVAQRCHRCVAAYYACGISLSMSDIGLTPGECGPHRIELHGDRRRVTHFLSRACGVTIVAVSIHARIQV